MNTAEKEDRSAIPGFIKRQVRQEAGFGCCKCGNPIFEYHHIIRDSEKPEDIMILCPICHHEATVGAMREEEQRLHKLNPLNIKRGYVDGALKINQKLPVIAIGTNQFIGEGDFVLVDQDSLLSFRVNSGGLEFSVKLDDRNGQLLAYIENNEWVSGDPLPWDLESSFQWLKIRHKSRNIVLEVNAKKFPIEIRADLWQKGQNFQLTPSQIQFNGVVEDFSSINLCYVAMRLVADTSKKQLRLEPDPRFGGSGAFISCADISQRIERGLKFWEQLKAKS